MSTIVFFLQIETKRDPTILETFGHELVMFRFRYEIKRQ
jgi:hypothetical protein